MPRIRSGYSFRVAAGKIEDVLARIKGCGYPAAPMTDRASTFGWVKWSKLCAKAELRPVFGVELAVTDSVNAKKPTIDYWSFFPQTTIRPINKLVELSTQQFRYEPLITYEQALATPGVFKLLGERAQLALVEPAQDVFVGLSPSCSRGYIRMCINKGLQLAACSDNKFVLPSDQGFYEVVCGRNASTQTYDQHIQTDEEWYRSVRHLGLTEFQLAAAMANRNMILEQSVAGLQKAHLLQPERPATLQQMCIEGAAKLGVDLKDPVYRDRMERELKLIKDKEFEDYFYIVSSICQFARSRMIVGPARGSSCGSLVCYLLGITMIDPIPYGLIFERFIDVNRNDLPDIDLDFSDQQRHLVFEYIAQKYGSEQVARLGTVAMFQPKSALKEVGAALRIPRFICDAVAESLLERSSGDSRAMQTLEDTIAATPAGKRLFEEYPAAIIAARMEGHPRHYCLSGETEIKIGQTNQVLKGAMSIKSLWDLYINSPSEDTERLARRGKQRMPVLVSLFPDGRCRPQKAAKIWFSGERECVRLLFSNGEEVVCTPEHKFLVNGSWIPCGSSKAGDEYKRTKRNLVVHPGKDFWKGKKRPDMANPSGGTYKAGAEHPNFRAGIGTRMAAQKKERVLWSCDDCSTEAWKDLHHNDKVHGAERPEDIAFLCKSCHRKRHAGEGSRWRKGVDIETVFLVSIESVGVKETFDIEMPEHHNFVLGNGIITSNSQHAAGIVITRDPVADVVAIDHRSGATMCDKYDAESLDMLKIDALGLTQLSVFEQALDMAGLDLYALDRIPLDDPAAFDILNKAQFSGIFQFNGMALKSLAKQFEVNCFNDIVSITALARPGPLTSGGATEWVKRRNGTAPITYPHPIFEPFLEDTMGVVLYQEQVMEIGRQIGDLDWGQVTALRKAMSKSLGKEYFDQFGDPWKKGAIAKGVDPVDANKVWDDLCLSGDTVLLNPFPSKGVYKTTTLKQLFKRGGLGPSKPNGALTRKRQSLLMWDGTSLKPSINWGVTFSGIKMTYEVITESGNSIRATENHKFLTPSGEYKPLSELRVGDEIMSDSGPIPTKRKAKKTSKVGRGIFADPIVSISEYKEEEVFDVHMPAPHHNFLANGIVVHNCAYGAWSFNKSHSVAYGMISYQCCWLKAHYPFEFAAATLTHESDPDRQIYLLREMAAEGFDYVPVDPEVSSDKWAIGTRDGKRILVGPLSLVEGIGPKTMNSIIGARARGEKLTEKAQKLLANPKTKIDSIFPIRDAFRRVMPDPFARNIMSQPTPIIDIDVRPNDYESMIFCVLSKINPRDENETIIMARRGYEITDGQTTSLNLQATDDTDTIFCKINRRDYERIGKPIVDRGKVGKHLYAIKGTVRGKTSFRMINVSVVRYIGEMP